jgi:hypothetical protein
MMELLEPCISTDLVEEYLLPALTSEKYLLHIINDIMDMA